jgi:hypothetical protein
MRAYDADGQTDKLRSCVTLRYSRCLHVHFSLQFISMLISSRSALAVVFAMPLPTLMYMTPRHAHSIYYFVFWGDIMVSILHISVHTLSTCFDAHLYISCVPCRYCWQPCLVSLLQHALRR